MTLSSVWVHIFQFLRGYAIKRVMIIFLFGLLICIGSVFIIAIIKYPDPFSILTKSVSSLGNRVKNPKNHLIWSIGMMALGVLMIPPSLYLYRIFHLIALKTSRISLGFLFLAMIGICGIGIFPEDTDLPHYIFASFAFFGFSVAFGCNFYIILRSYRLHNSWPRLWQVILVYFIWLGSLGSFLFFFLLFWLWYFWDIWFFMFYLPLWEWIFFLGYAVHFYGLLFIVPGSIPVDGKTTGKLSVIQ